MSIKIEGGDGTVENVIKAGTSNELLYNDKEVLLKENLDLGLDLLPPDLSKIQDWDLTSEIEEGDYTAHYSNPFIVPKDGWIVAFRIIFRTGGFIEIDGHGGMGITPGQELLVKINNEPVVRHNINCPYPVKKGQVVRQEHVTLKIHHSYITFAPCMSV